MEPSEHARYFQHVARHWEFWSLVWDWFRPPTSGLCIAYERGGRVHIVRPTPHMLMLLKRGGVIRHMRQIDSFGPRGIPVFEGSGELMGPMTEREAVEFVGWKDIPREVNHRVVLHESGIPRDRSRRNEWRLGEAGIEVPA